MRPMGVAALSAVVVLLAGACSGAEPIAAPPPSAQPTTSTPAPTTTTTTKAPTTTSTTKPRKTTKKKPRPKPKDPGVTVAFAGDVHFEDRNRRLLNDPATAFGPISKVLKKADLAMINLETPVTTRGSAEDKPYLFRSPPSTYDAVRAAGIDAVSLANNHVLDYGHVGLSDTLRHAVNKGVPTYGAGENGAQAWKPWITEVDGTRIAIVGLSATEKSENWRASQNRYGIAHTVNESRSIRAVQRAARNADVVIVHAHWGEEREECPDGRQKNLARKLAAAGADAVVGSHSHVLQGEGWLDDTYVHYGLGNFVWYSNLDGSNRTGVLRLTIDDEKITKSDFVPAKIDRTGRPIPATGKRAERTREVRDDLRKCAGLSTTPG